MNKMPFIPSLNPLSKTCSILRLHSLCKLFVRHINDCVIIFYSLAKPAAALINNKHTILKSTYFTNPTILWSMMDVFRIPYNHVPVKVLHFVSATIHNLLIPHDSQYNIQVEYFFQYDRIDKMHPPQ